MRTHALWIALLLIVPATYAVASDNPGPAGNGLPFPQKLLSGYSGYGVNRDMLQEAIDNYLEPMCRAGFNACDFKIQPPTFDLSQPVQLRRLRELSQAMRARKMVLLTYLYPTNSARDPKRDAELPAFVGSDGLTVERRFSLIDWPTWRKIFDNAFQLARVSRELQIAAVRLDVEPLNDGWRSYDDAAWKRFAPLHGLPADLPAAGRFPLLTEKKLDQVYARWFDAQLDEIAKRFEREMHAVNPELKLGVMPAEGTLAEAFVKYSATRQAPALIDDWSMYNPLGFTPAVLKRQAEVKAANPYNLYIPWFRLNNYHPQDITVQAYYAAMSTDGYSSWSLGMINKNWRKHKGGMYSLPLDYTSDDYYRAYGAANKLVREDLAAGRKTPAAIAYRPVALLAPPLKLDEVQVPNLQPAGSGNGEPQWIALREQQVIYVYAQAAENIRIELAHMAGVARNIPVSYRLIDARRAVLGEGLVAPGKHETVLAKAARTGTYALVITGGSGGQAWYGVRVYNQHMGILAPTYLMYCRPCTLWVTRNARSSPARVCVITAPDNQAFAAQLDDGPAIGCAARAVFDLPPERETCALKITRPAVLKNGTYTQDIFVRVEGNVEPYLADGAERRLTEHKSP